MIYQQGQLLINYYLIKILIFQKNPKYDRYQRVLASVVYKKAASGADKSASVGNIKDENMLNEELAE